MSDIKFLFEDNCADDIDLSYCDIDPVLSGFFRCDTRLMDSTTDNVSYVGDIRYWIEFGEEFYETEPTDEAKMWRFKFENKTFNGEAELLVTIIDTMMGINPYSTRLSLKL